MTLERTHGLIIAHAKPGKCKNHYHIEYGENFRESDLKEQWKLQHVSYQHGTIFKSALKS